MDTLEKSIALYSSELLPRHIRENSPLFVEFIKSYYEWMEQGRVTDIDEFGRELIVNGNVNNVSHVFGEMHRDGFIEEYYNLYSREYARLYPLDMPVRKDLFIKTVSTLLRGKSTISSIKAFFRILFGEIVEISYPEGRSLLPISRSNILLRGFAEGITYGEYKRIFRLSDSFVTSNSGSILYVESVNIILQFNDQLLGELEDDDIVEGRVVYTLSCSNQKNGEVVELFGVREVSILGNVDGTPVNLRLYRVVSEFKINDGGDGYRVGDVLLVRDASEVLPAEVVVTQIIPTPGTDYGSISGLRIIDPGVGFRSNLITTTTLKGSGLGQSGLANEEIGNHKDEEIGSRSSEQIGTLNQSDNDGLFNNSVESEEDTTIQSFINEPIEKNPDTVFLEEDQQLFDIEFRTSYQFDVAESSNINLNDNSQAFKYEVNTSLPVESWLRLLTEIVHPCGVEVVNKVKIVTIASRNEISNLTVRSVGVVVNNFDDIRKFVAENQFFDGDRNLESRSLVELTEPYETGHYDDVQISDQENREIDDFNSSPDPVEEEEEEEIDITIMQADIGPLENVAANNRYYTSNDGLIVIILDTDPLEQTEGESSGSGTEGSREFGEPHLRSIPLTIPYDFTSADGSGLKEATLTHSQFEIGGSVSFFQTGLFNSGDFSKSGLQLIISHATPQEFADLVNDVPLDTKLYSFKATSPFDVSTFVEDETIPVVKLVPDVSPSGDNLITTDIAFNDTGSILYIHQIVDANGFIGDSTGAGFVSVFVLSTAYNVSTATLVSVHDMDEILSLSGNYDASIGDTSFLNMQFAGNSLLFPNTSGDQNDADGNQIRSSNPFVYQVLLNQDGTLSNDVRSRSLREGFNGEFEGGNGLLYHDDNSLDVLGSDTFVYAKFRNPI